MSLVSGWTISVTSRVLDTSSRGVQVGATMACTLLNKIVQPKQFDKCLIIPAASYTVYVWIDGRITNRQNLQ